MKTPDEITAIVEDLIDRTVLTFADGNPDSEYTGTEHVIRTLTPLSRNDLISVAGTAVAAVAGMRLALSDAIHGRGTE